MTDALASANDRHGDSPEGGAVGWISNRNAQDCLNLAEQSLTKIKKGT
jgi:hypothetical protein